LLSLREGHARRRRHGPNKVPRPFALELQRRVHALVPVVGDIATTTMQVIGLMERIANEKDANREHRPWTKDRVLQLMCGGCEGGDNSTKERMMSDAALAATEKERRRTRRRPTTCHPPRRRKTRKTRTRASGRQRT